jgi:hypothetical protein
MPHPVAGLEESIPSLQAARSLSNLNPGRSPLSANFGDGVGEQSYELDGSVGVVVAEGMEVAEELRGLLKPFGEDDSAEDCIAQAMEQDVVDPPQARRSVRLAGNTPRGK